MPSALMMYKLQGVLTPESIREIRQNQPALIDRLNEPESLVDLAGSVADMDDADRAYM